MKVLITAGGTEEPIDGVRRLTNTSTGATGGTLARHFVAQGAEVLLLHAERAVIGEVAASTETFVTFSDLEGALHRHLCDREWDAVVHLAAVSDYSIDTIEVDGADVAPGGRGKIGTGREVVIRLTANPKIIDSLKMWSLNPGVRVVGFKLTEDADQEMRENAVGKLMERGGADLVVHNDARQINGRRHAASFFGRKGLIGLTETKEQMAERLWAWLEEGETA